MGADDGGDTAAQDHGPGDHLVGSGGGEQGGDPVVGGCQVGGVDTAGHVGDDAQQVEAERAAGHGGTGGGQAGEHRADLAVGQCFTAGDAQAAGDGGGGAADLVGPVGGHGGGQGQVEQVRRGFRRGQWVGVGQDRPAGGCVGVLAVVGGGAVGGQFAVGVGDVVEGQVEECALAEVDVGGDLVEQGVECHLLDGVAFGGGDGSGDGGHGVPLGSMSSAWMVWWRVVR